MRDLLAAQIRGLAPVAARNLVREALQARILAALAARGAMIPLAFQGGTALRFLYGIRRFSEDLQQTGWQGPEPTEESWREIVAERIRALDWTRVGADVEPFLESRADLELVTRENVLRLLGSDAGPTHSPPEASPRSPPG